MAFLVCYSKSLSDHTENEAIYLDQQFYELIFRNCGCESSGFVPLRKIASLRYKSPTILFAIDELPILTAELKQLEKGRIQHPQINDFKDICMDAIKNDDFLTISGDMYPEL